MSLWSSLLIVWGRNYEEILNQWRIITKEKQADIVVLDMPLLDTRRTGKDLTGTFCSGSCPANPLLCSADGTGKHSSEANGGIAAAKLRGVRFGRPRKPIPERFFRLKAQWEKEKSVPGKRQRNSVLHKTHSFAGFVNNAERNSREFRSLLNLQVLQCILAISRRFFYRHHKLYWQIYIVFYCTPAERKCLIFGQGQSRRKPVTQKAKGLAGITRWQPV